jgi:TRAP-type mannitol/chloroaromatic compound transport system permease small subunit
MQNLLAFADRIDRLNAALGRAAAWCVLFMVAAQFLVVVLRYVFGIGSVWLQESVLYSHAALILLVAAWTLWAGGHVRVDIFYAGMSGRAKAWVDLAGAVLLLLPFMAALIYFAAPYVGRSWAIFERSREVGGLPLIWLLKTLIPLFAVLLALQGVAQAIRAGSALQSLPPDPPRAAPGMALPRGARDAV